MSAARNYSIPTLKYLFGLTGNQCAKCKTIIILPDKSNIGQVCHIQAASPGGERYNPNMTDIERASYDNLMILCANCHIETNNVAIFTTAEMQKIKAQHEAKYQKTEPSEDQLTAFLQSTSYDIDFTNREDWGILEAIIKYTLDNAPKSNMTVDEIKASKNFIAFQEKVKLNLPQQEIASFSRQYINSTARQLAIDEYLTRLSEEDPVKVDELREAVIQNYCNIKGVSDPETRIDSLKTIEELALSLIPDVKKHSPQYIGVARALVIQTFEFCSIGQKTQLEAQLSIFDLF
ncbi:hypothetical protein [Dyadobacter chenhuakuii]|uniref:Uncharacterized protein n=1 Tax=Dyadobacter chenhuakuii TaxID=2909339 RepID=A0A9X1QF96_9BACT|nr:hypothetical protein [Dyadobacter chenhuakuii]MCF2500818.1 hypothetical protein [Dyadobacter chenhuakuii]